MLKFVLLVLALAAFPYVVLVAPAGLAALGMAVIYKFYLLTKCGSIWSIKTKDFSIPRAIIVAFALVAVTTTIEVVTQYDATIRYIESENEEVDYNGARLAVDSMVAGTMGSGGATKYYVYRMGAKLTGSNLKKFLIDQATGGEIGIGTIVNVVVHVVPFILKLVLTDWLGVVAQPGYVSMLFWTLVFAFIFVLSAALTDDNKPRIIVKAA